MTHPPGTESGYRRTPLSAEENLRAEANFVPYVIRMLAASGRFRVSADTPDQVELFQAVARRVSEVLQQPVVSYANGREIVITFGRQEPPASLAEAPSQHRSDRFSTGVTGLPGLTVAVAPGSGAARAGSAGSGPR